MARLKKLEPLRIFEQVVQQIRGLIVSGELAPGDKLPTEQELEKQLSVSRSSIREALRVLEVEGLVEVRRGSGTYVASGVERKRTRGEITSWLEQQEDLLFQVLQVREYIEGLTASLSAVNATNEDLARINHLFESMKQTVQGETANLEVDINEMVDLDSRFHLAIGQASGNNVAYEIISQIIPAFQESNKAVIYVSDQVEETLKDHYEIKLAIEARDPKRAEAAIRKHISRVREDLEMIVFNT